NIWRQYGQIHDLRDAGAGDVPETGQGGCRPTASAPRRSTAPGLGVEPTTRQDCGDGLRRATPLQLNGKSLLAPPLTHRTPSARSRLKAALIKARWVKACGKLPRASPLVPVCSAYRPRWLAYPSI